MSTDASIQLSFIMTFTDVMDVIYEFEKIGWKPFDKNKQVEYLPLDDHDGFNWKTAMLTRDELEMLVHRKEQQGEIIGLALFYEHGEEGIQLLANNPNDVSLSLSTNRRTANYSYRTTDIIWYYEHIVQKLLKEGYIEWYGISEYLG